MFGIGDDGQDNSHGLVPSRGGGGFLSSNQESEEKVQEEVR